MYPEEKINMILQLFEDPTIQSINDTREKLGADFYYNQVRVIFNYWRMMHAVDRD